nr:uncharacterized protein LOC123285082 [Equus asinus]
MRVSPAPGPGRGRRGAEGAAAGVPALRGRRAVSAQHSRARRGPELVWLGRGRRGGCPLPPRPNGAAPSAARSNKRLRLPFKVCPSLPSRSARRRARPPPRVRPRPPGPGAAARSRGRRRGGAAPPPRLEAPRAAAASFASLSTPLLLQPREPGPSSSPTAGARSQSDRRLGAKSSASSLWKSSRTAS